MNDEVAKKLEVFFTKYKKQMYKKGELLIRSDEDPSGIFYLKSGNVRQYIISEEGNEYVVNIFKPISFFPMSWAINSTPNEYFYEASTEVELHKAQKRDVVDFVKSNPDVLFDLLRRVYKGTDGILKRLTYLMSGNARSRLITEILIHIKRFGGKEKNNETIGLKISEKDLASQVGIARETVSRELKHLREKGLITFEKNILTIKNIRDLESQLNN